MSKGPFKAKVFFWFFVIAILCLGLIQSPAIAADTQAPVVYDLVVPANASSGSSLTVTFKVRDDVGLAIVGGGPFAFVRLMQGNSQIQIPNVNPTLVSGDVKDGSYTITFTLNNGLLGNYQVKAGAYDGTSKLGELTSSNIYITSTPTPTPTQTAGESTTNVPLPRGDVSCSLTATGVSYGVSMTFTSGNVAIGNLTYDWDYARLNEGKDASVVSNYGSRAFFKNTNANSLSMSYQELLELAGNNANATLIVFASPKNTIGLSTITNRNGKGCYVELPVVLNEVNKRQAEAKSAAELKAKQEAEAKAKAEAEAKAKAEAEAKAKALAEAEAKAKADLAARELAEKPLCDARRRELTQIGETLTKFIKNNPGRSAEIALTVARLNSALNSSCVAEVTLSDFQREATELMKTSSKKTTITCVKGKITKKITAVNPKCPAGYKRK